MLTVWIYSLRVRVSITVLCIPLSQCFKGDICVLNLIPMHSNSKFSCAKVGSRWSNQNRRFGGHSRSNNCCRWCMLGPIRIAASAAIHVSIIFAECMWLVRLVPLTAACCIIRSLTAKRKAWPLTVVCSVFLHASFADFWEVFDIIACIHTCYIVAYHSDTVYLLFVCETDRYKPVKYGRFGAVWTAVYEIKALHSINMASMPTHDTNTCTGALHH